MEELVEQLFRNYSNLLAYFYTTKKLLKNVDVHMLTLIHKL